MKLIFALFSAAALAAPSTNLLRARQSPRVQLTDVSYRGSACPANSIQHTIDEEGLSISFTYSAFRAIVGGNDDFPGKQDCEVSIGLRYPIGCTSAKVDVTHVGFGLFADGITGSATSQYALSAGSANPSTGAGFPLSFSTLNGTSGGPVSWTDRLDTTANVASAAQQDAIFTVRSGVTITAPSEDLVGNVDIDNLAFFIHDQEEC